MAKPLLQIALDNNTLSDAIRSISQVGHEVDIIEAGTILCLAEGMEAVRCLRALYPNKIILADTKCNMLRYYSYDEGSTERSKGLTGRALRRLDI